MATIPVDEWPDLQLLQNVVNNPRGAINPNPMNWRSKLPDVDPNPATVDDGVESPTSEERAMARPNLDTGQKRNLCCHDGNLKVKPEISKSDLVLPNLQGRVEEYVMCLG